MKQFYFASYLPQKGIVIIMKKIGILENNFQMNKTGTVYGAKVARVEFLEALIEYSSCDKIVFNELKDTYSEMMLKRLFKKTVKKREIDIEIDIVNRMDLLQKKDRLDIDILHDTGPDFLHAMFFRDKYANGSPPFTFTLHCSSIPHYMFDYYFYQFLMPCRPYDSLICTSSALKTVVDNYMNSISEKFNKWVNTDFKYKGRTDIIPLGVDLNKFYPLNKSECKKKLGIADDCFVILFLGRVSAFDKADLIPLLHTLKKLVVANPNKQIKLIISGKEVAGMPLFPAFKEYASKFNLTDNIIFMDGNMEDRLELYNASDIFVSPIDNLQETFGITPIEAMACGTPQVVTDWNGYKDTVVDGITGFRIPTIWCKCDDDINGFPFAMNGDNIFFNHFSFAQSVIVDTDIFYSRIQECINNPSLLKQMSENSLQRAKEKYSWKKIIPQYEELWKFLYDIKIKTQDCADDDKRMFYGLFNNDYFNTYKEYPTYTIQIENKTIEITDEGDMLKDDLTMLYPIQKIFYENTIAYEVLITLKKVRHLKVQMILNKYFEKYNQDVIKRAIMYLAKYGYIKFI